MGKLSLSLLWFLTACLLVAGLALWHWPTTNYEIPANQIASKPTKPEMKINSSLIESFANRFDHTALPKPVAPKKPVPVIDPAADLKRWVLTGVIQSDNKAMALFSRGKSSIMREVGDELDGFTLEEITPRKVLFRRETLAHELSLPNAPIQKISLNR